MSYINKCGCIDVVDYLRSKSTIVITKYLNILHSYITYITIAIFHYLQLSFCFISERNFVQGKLVVKCQLVSVIATERKVKMKYCMS